MLALKNKEIKSEDDYDGFISYDTSAFQKAFNTILYNFIKDQAKRNKEVWFTEIDYKIAESKKKILNSYDNIVNKAESDQEAASHFAKFIYQQQLQVVAAELLEVYDDKILMIDSEITKQENLKQSNKVFQDAEDTETIIMHMRDPIELEKRVFKRKYKSVST